MLRDEDNRFGFVPLTIGFVRIFMVTQDSVHRGKLAVPGGDLGLGEVEVMIDHFEGGVTQYFLQRVDIPAVKQVVDGESMPAQVGMNPCDAGLFFKPGEEKLNSVFGNRTAVFSRRKGGYNPVLPSWAGRI